MTLELTDGAKSELDRLREATEAASNAEVIRRSLAFYSALVEQSQGGCRLEIVSPNGERREMLLVP